MSSVETHANALISDALKAIRKAQVAANRPGITVAQTFGGLIPN
jgi:hypothetical protein